MKGHIQRDDSFTNYYFCLSIYTYPMTTDKEGKPDSTPLRLANFYYNPEVPGIVYTKNTQSQKEIGHIFFDQEGDFTGLENIFDDIPELNSFIKESIKNGNKDYYENLENAFKDLFYIYKHPTTMISRREIENLIAYKTGIKLNFTVNMVICVKAPDIHEKFIKFLNNE